MAKKKAGMKGAAAKKPAKKAGGGKKTMSKRAGHPDAAALRNYSPTDNAESHPKWVKEQFPTYIGPGTGHETTAVREFTHNGHVVKIITTYRVEVDGKSVHGHLSVDEDGRVYTHATPFVTYASAVDLMKAVIDGYPNAFSDSSHHGHSGHGEGHQP